MTTYNSTIEFDTLANFLSARDYKEVYNNVPSNKIGNELIAQFNYLFSLIGEEMPESFLTVQGQENGRGNYDFKNLLTPKVYKATAAQVANSAYAKANPDAIGDEMPAIKFNQELVVPLAAFEALMEDTNVDVTEAAGQLVVQIMLPESDEFPEGLIYEVGLRLKDYENPPKAITAKRAYGKPAFTELLSGIKTGGGIKKLYELGEGTEHTVVGYTSKEGQYGLQFTLILSDGTKVWGNRAVENVLLNSPTISSELPAILNVGTISTTKAGKTKVQASLLLQSAAFDKDDFAGFDLNW